MKLLEFEPPRYDRRTKYIDLRDLKEYIIEGQDFELPSDPENNLAIDPRPVYFGQSPRSFDIKIDRSRIAITNTSQENVWRDPGFLSWFGIRFRVYDRTRETVPPFDSSEPYIYWGFKGEYAPHDAVHVKVHSSVTKIRSRAFYLCTKMVTCDMRDAPVDEIEDEAFGYCRSIKTIFFSNVLKKIGHWAFYQCKAIDMLVIPSTVRDIRKEAFGACINLKCLMLPDAIDLEKVAGKNMLTFCDALRDAVPDDMEPEQWLKDRYDSFPLHKLCYDYCAHVTDDTIQQCIEAFPNAASLSDEIGMTALHIMVIATYTFQESQTTTSRSDTTTQGPSSILLTTNRPPGTATAEGCIMKIFDANMAAALERDRTGKTPLDYLLEYDFVEVHNAMVASLCVHRVTMGE